MPGATCQTCKGLGIVSTGGGGPIMCVDCSGSGREQTLLELIEHDVRGITVELTNRKSRPVFVVCVVIEGPDEGKVTVIQPPEVDPQAVERALRISLERVRQANQQARKQAIQDARAGTQRSGNGHNRYPS